MQLRLTRSTRNGKRYEYAQLVESYRRESDGLPTHRVVANLGVLSELELENLRTSLKASRERKRVVLARAPTRQPRPVANLRYLDAAVLLEIWNQWSLSELLSELVPAGAADVSPAHVIAALTLQRGTDPGSKLYATRWFPRSALPELLAVPPKAFNNTRVHRVLDALDAAGPRLMAALPQRYQEREGAFVSLFLDTTDTWFVGEGPELASKGKTKEGMVRQKVGIVLLCNQHGYPLRWETVSGASADCTVMTQMFQSIAGLSWVGEAPVVCDRAMGHTAQIVEMNRTKLRFLTALTISEMGQYAAQLPHAALAGLQPSFSVHPQQAARDAEQAAAAAQAAGMTRVDDDLLVLDVGMIERPVETSTRSRPDRSGGGSAQDAMRLARAIAQGVADGRYPSQAKAGRAHGLSKSLASKYCQLQRLPEDVQREILDGRAGNQALVTLLRIADLNEADAQREAFRALPQAPVRQTIEHPPPRREPKDAAEPAQPDTLKVRVVAYFNPERFVEQRSRAQEHLQNIQAFVTQMNTSLASGRSRYTATSAASAVDRQLRRYDLVEAFKVAVSEQEASGSKRLTVETKLDEQEWALRRRYDGFTVLVAHPALPHGPVELCQLYRAKDAVEKDFEVIKSVVEVRPVRHHTDGKVRAHVTLCMLALLLERTLQKKLKGKYTSQTALELLRECRLNHFAARDGGTAAYTLNEVTAEQAAILRLLGYQKLGDEEQIVDRIVPR